MAKLFVQDEKIELTDAGEISKYLDQYGMTYRNWDVAGRIGAEATDEEILAAYSPEIEKLKEEGGFVTADIINVTPAVPGLDELLAKFDKEHTHDEDEIRFVVKGRGIFHINPESGPVFAVYVEQGDLINVPAGTKHWFEMCEDKTIRCIRLFEDMAGWTPHYTETGIHEKYDASHLA